MKGGDWSEDAKMYLIMNGEDPNMPVYFGTEIYSVSRTVPLVMQEDMHEPGVKTIVGDFTIPSGQTGMQDIEMAVDHLFDHDNVGPFVARRMIQQLIKSNPTAEHISIG